MTIQSAPASTPTDSGSTFRPTKFPPSAAAAAASARFELGEADEEECVVVCGAEAEVREVLSRTPAQNPPSTSAEHAWTGTSGLSPFAQLGDFHGRATVTLATLTHWRTRVCDIHTSMAPVAADRQCCYVVAGKRVL